MLREFTAFFNKQYRDEPDGGFLLKLQQAFLQTLLNGYSNKRLPAHIFYADDCFVVYRNLGFLQNVDFQNALQAAKVDQVMLGRVWRLWILAWSMRLRWDTAGVILDCGTYNGCALEVALHYAYAKFGVRSSSIVACDLFDSPPEEARKTQHGPGLHREVTGRLNPYGDVTVVKGLLPRALSECSIDLITWCQIDLNSADADSQTFEYIFPLLADGAMVIFDDYGFSRYAATQGQLDEFLKKSNAGQIVELPTGQGLYVHRL